jgi:hypothetical protein
MNLTFTDRACFLLRRTSRPNQKGKNGEGSHEGAKKTRKTAKNSREERIIGATPEPLNFFFLTPTEESSLDSM